MSRARDKRRALAAAGWDNASLADIGLTEAELLAQYFEQRLGQPIPADCSAYAERLGFPDAAAFVRTLLAEYCYLSGLQSTKPAGGRVRNSPA